MSNHQQLDFQQVDRLRPYARNARTHSKKQVRQIADSIGPDAVFETLASDTARNLSIIAAIEGLVDRGHKRIILFAVSVDNAEVLADALVANGLNVWKLST